MSGPVLSVEGLAARAGGRALVRDVTFEAAAGEIVAIIGPNGAGKTSLLEAIAGLRPSEGAVRVDGHAVRTFAERAASFAFAPDDALPPPEVLVATLIAHAESRRPRPKGALDALRRGLGVEPLMDRSAGVLSRGERKRVSLYVALAAARPIVILDEPFGAFDPLQLQAIFEAVRETARAGAALLVSIHQLADAARVADRVLLLAEGRRVAFGKVDAVLEQAGAASLEEAFVALLAPGTEARRAS